MNPVAINTTEKETVALQSTIARHDFAKSSSRNVALRFLLLQRVI